MTIQLPDQINSMQHWNCNQLCAIDLETTGTDPQWDSIWQISILPLNNKIEPRKDVPFLNLIVQPENEKRIKWNEVKNKFKIQNAIRTGLAPKAAREIVIKYITERLGLQFNKYGNQYRIIPLGHNVIFDINFLQQWFDPDAYFEYFDARYRDTMQIASYINDRLNFRAEIPKFEKVDLAWVCNKLGIKNISPHDALSDCIATAKVYKKFCDHSLML